MAQHPTSLPGVQKASLSDFVRECPADALDTLILYLAQRSQEYIDTSRKIARHTERHDTKAHLRVAHHLSMAQALFTLAEHITQEREHQQKQEALKQHGRELAEQLGVAGTGKIQLLHTTSQP